MQVNETDTVLLRRAGSFCILTLSRPARLNAISTQMRLELRDRLREVVADPGCRAIILTGADGVFCSGSDIGQMGTTEMPPAERLGILHDIVRLIVQAPQPVIAAVEGVAAGAGLSLAVACDYLITAEDARLIPAFVRLGLIPDSGILWSLPRRVGPARANGILTRVRQMPVDDAQMLGMVDLVCRSGATLNTALGICQDIALAAPLAVAATKRVLIGNIAALEQAFAQELAEQASLRRTQDHLEARAAFRERRPPVFRGH